MQKIFLTTIFACILAFNAIAQLSVSRVKFGVQASPTAGWINTNDNNIKGNGFNTGLKLGVTADYFFNENYAIATGLGFGFNHGGKLIHDVGGNFLPNSPLSDSRLNQDAKSLSDGVSIRYHIQYVEVPFSLKMRTQQFGYLRYIAEAPILTIGVRTKTTGDITDPDTNKFPESFVKENIKSDVNPLALSWGFGGGIQYDISPSTAFVGGIYFQKGFLDMTRNKGAVKSTSVEETSKGTLNNIILRLGIIF